VSCTITLCDIPTILLLYYYFAVTFYYSLYSKLEYSRYKVPFLRSEMDSKIDKHTKIERLMSSDLDHWMCNLYFEVIQLPKLVSFSYLQCL